MNKARIIVINNYLKRLQSINETIQKLCSIEEDAYNNLPESLLNGPRGEIMNEMISCLDEAGDRLDDAIEQIEEIYDHIPERILAYLYPWGHLKVGDHVSHGKFGHGVIIKKDKKTIMVEFDERTSKFNFPDCFEQNYLTMEE